LHFFKHGLVLSLVIGSFLAFSFGAQKGGKKGAPPPPPPEKGQAQPQKGQFNGDAIAEATIITYGGRNSLALVKVNGIEKDTVLLPTTGGDKEGQLTTRFVRKEKSWLDFKRIDLTMPDADALSLGFNGAKVWATLNGLAIEPRPEAEKTFRASMIHSYDALLRYREDGSKLEAKPNQTIKGIECYVVEMTHEDGSHTTFYVSAKTLHILHIEYETQLTSDKPTKFKVSYYEYRTVQNVLVPMRTEIYENGVLTQKLTTTSITFNVSMDDDVFNHS